MKRNVGVCGIVGRIALGCVSVAVVGRLGVASLEAQGSFPGRLET